VCFIIHKTTSELVTPIVDALGRRIYSMLFLWMFRWFIVPKPAVATDDIRDDNFTLRYGYPWVPDLTGTCIGTKFYSRVVPVPDPSFGRCRGCKPEASH
jgi:hypothetical protein